MSPRLAPNEFFHPESPALATIKRADAFVELLAQPAQLLDVRKKPPADLLLVGVRKASHLRNRSLERPHHAGFLSRRTLPRIDAHSMITPPERASPGRALSPSARS